MKNPRQGTSNIVPNKAMPPHPSKQTYDALPQIQQLVRTIQELKARNAALEERVLTLETEKEGLEGNQASLKECFDNQKRVINKLLVENDELQSKVLLKTSLEPHSPCLRRPGSPSKQATVNFSTEIAKVVPIDNRQSPSKVPKHEEFVVTTGSPRLSEGRAIIQEVVQYARPFS